MDMLRTPGDQENIMARLRPASSPAYMRCFFPLCFPPCEILRACVLCIEEKFPDGPSAVGAQPLKRLRRVAAIGIWRVF